MQKGTSEILWNHLWECQWQESQAYLVLISYFNSDISTINYTTSSDWWNSLKCIWAKTIKSPLRSRLEMSHYFTSRGVFANNFNVCYHSEIMPASVYLEEVRIFSIHKILSPPGVWNSKISLYWWVSLTTVISLWLNWLRLAISWTSHITWKILIVRNTRCIKCFFHLNNFTRQWILASSPPHGEFRWQCKFTLA